MFSLTHPSAPSRMYGLVVAVVLLVQLCFGADIVYRNHSVAYAWSVSEQLIADSSGTGDTLGHSFTWPVAMGPIGVVGCVVMHIDTVLHSSPNAWAYDQAVNDRYYLEGFDPSLEVGYVAYFDTLIQHGVEGYIMGSVFKFWDDPVIYFQESRYLGYETNYGVVIFALTDTVDVYKYYALYDQVASSLRLVNPAGVLPMMQFYVTAPRLCTRKSKLLLLLSRTRQMHSCYNLFGARCPRTTTASGLYLKIEQAKDSKTAKFLE